MNADNTMACHNGMTDGCEENWTAHISKSVCGLESQKMRRNDERFGVGATEGDIQNTSLTTLTDNILNTHYYVLLRA